MSAYIVEDKVIRYLIASAIRFDAYVKVPKVEGRGDRSYDNVSKFDAEELDALGQILLDENYRSVDARYKEQDSSAKFSFGKLKNAGYSLDKIAPAQVFASVANYEYQASETDDFEASEAYDFTSRLVRSVGNSLRKQDEKGHLVDTVWGAPDPEYTGRKKP